MAIIILSLLASYWHYKGDGAKAPTPAAPAVQQALGHIAFEQSFFDFGIVTEATSSGIPSSSGTTALAKAIKGVVFELFF